MKILTILLGGILIVSQPVFADLSVPDLEKIDEIVRESEKRIKEYVAGDTNSIKITSITNTLNSPPDKGDLGGFLNLVMGNHYLEMV